MKATNRDYLKAAQRAGDACRLFFLCGPDEAGAHAGAGKLLAALPEAGERVELSGQDLRGDPVRLVDEARSTSLFGDTRHLFVRVAGEDAHDAIRTFCELKDRGEADRAWPVFIVATSASDKSRSAKLLLGRKDALVAVFYPPEFADFTADVRAMADAAGLRLGGDMAERIGRAAGLDARLAQAEIEKLALFLDASPQSPKRADAAAFEAIGAVTEEDGFMPLVNATLSGEVRKLPAEIARLKEMSLNPVGVALALERRVAQLAALRSRMRPDDDIGRFLDNQRVFFRDRRDLAQQLRQWPGGKLERLVPRLMRLHRALLATHQQAELVLAQELVEIARQAEKRR